MIKISEEIKKLYIEDSTPIELEVRFKDNAFPTIKGSDVLSEQMTLHESICEEEQLKFGGCNASSFELTVYGLDKSVKGKEIMPVLITSETEIPLGVFYIDTVEKFAGKDYVKITAYDRIKYFDTDVKDWYKNLVFPITIKNFRNSLCKYIGIEQNEASLIVDDIVIQKDIDYTSNVNGLTILQNICEISGVFGRMDRYGKLDYLSLTNEKALDIPSSLVYEYPVVEDFETKIIDGAIIVDSEGAEYETDIRTNPYYIRDNFVIIGQTEATIKSIAKKLVEKINGIKYVPVSISKIKGQPYAECGDYAHGEIKSYAFDTYIFQREITGIKVLRDSYVAKGKEYLENDINSVTSTLLKLNEMIGRTRTSIKKTEEGLTIDIKKAVKASNEYSDGAANTAKNEAIKNTDEKLKNYSTTEEMQTAIKASEKGFSVIVGSTIKNSVEEFYLSDSPTSLIGGSWSKTQPTWTDGKYIWQRTLITRGNDETEYSPSEKGVCITGNTGAKGDPGEKGDPGTNGKSIGSVVNYYLATNLSSDVSTSTTGWTTSVQSVSASKKYLWNYEVIKYTDGTVASTTTPCIIGSYGDTGLKGDPGVGISSITEHYAVSPSNTTAPTSWSTTVPTMTTTNKYLWNYETVKYTNNTSKDTGKRVIGVYGDKGSKGDAGKGVKSSKITYQVSSSGTAIPTGTWSDSIPSVSAGWYLWTKTVITYTDNTTSTSYSVGRNGTNGKKGNDGKGIKSTEVTYQAGASGTTAPTGAWQSSPQTTSASLPYMWTKTVITYTDNTTSTSYSVGCTPEGIQVGGTNLATNTNKGTSGWGWSMQKGGYTATAVIENGISTCKLTRNTVAQSGWSVIRYEYIGRNKWKANTTYTLSMEVKSNVSTSLTPGFKNASGSNGLIQSCMTIKNTTTANTWVKLIWIVKSVATLPSDTSQSTYFTGMNSGTGVWYQFRNLKLEEGNKATDWSPAPEDVDAQIQTVRTQVTEAQTEISSTKESIKLLATKTEVTTVSNNLSALTKTVSNYGTAIDQNAKAISIRATKEEVTKALNGKVSTGEVVSHVNSELKVSGNRIDLTTGHFTIDSDNIKVDETGNLTITGDLTSQGAIKVSKGDLLCSIALTSEIGYKLVSYSLSDSLSVWTSEEELLGQTAFTVSSNTQVFVMPKYLYGDTSQFKRGNFTENLGTSELAVAGNAGILGDLKVEGKINGRTWYWSGQGGQPSWLWGGNDGANMYVYNPANFSVNYATSSGSTNDGRLKGLNRIRTGTVVLGSDRGTGTSRLLFNLDYVKQLLGSSNVSPYDVAIVVNNGDAEAHGGHPHGVTYAVSSQCFYVIFKDQVGTNPIRINFAIIWGTGN